MGFTLGRKPNPLVNAFGSLAGELTKRATEGRENRIIGDAFKKLQDPNTSNIEALQMLSQLDVSPEKKEFLGRGFEAINQQKMKQAALMNQKQEMEQRRARNVQVAGHLGLENPEQYADVEPTQIVAIHKSKNPKPAGGITAQPIPKDQLAVMNEIDAGNPNASPAKRAQLYSEAGVPESAYKFRIESQQAELKPSERELQIEKSQATSDVKYNEQLQEASKQHELKEQTLERLDKLNKKGVTGKPYEKLLEKAGLTALTSEGRREFAADVKNLITDIRSILGAQFTGFEFQTILNAYPSADFSKEANAAIIRNLKEFQDIKKKEVEFANELKKQNKGKIPFDFQAQVNEKVRDYASSKASEIKANTKKIINEEYGIPDGFTLMFDPNGNELSVPDAEVEMLLKQGATLP